MNIQDEILNVLLSPRACMINRHTRIKLIMKLDAEHRAKLYAPKTDWLELGFWLAVTAVATVAMLYSYGSALQQAAL